MAEATFWAAFWERSGASALIIGAEVAFAFRLSGGNGLVMALGVGASIPSVSAELTALHTAEISQVALGLEQAQLSSCSVTGR
jgi:hypothetical protein